MKTNLLDFFNERSENVKNTSSNTRSPNNIGVAKYRFIVSNNKIGEDNTIEISSLFDLDFAVATYFSETDTEPRSRIIIAENLDQNKKMYVYLELHQ